MRIAMAAVLGIVAAAAIYLVTHSWQAAMGGGLAAAWGDFRWMKRHA